MDYTTVRLRKYEDDKCYRICSETLLDSVAVDTPIEIETERMGMFSSSNSIFMFTPELLSLWWHIQLCYWHP